MRRIGVFALLFVAGCSLVWNMDPYESGSGAADVRDGATSSSGAASSSGSPTGTSSSGGSSGTENRFDAAFDAAILEGDAAAPLDAAIDANDPCLAEAEPNNSAVAAEAVIVGMRKCGSIAGIADDDWFKVALTDPATLLIDLGANVRVFVHFDDGNVGWSQTPGMKTVSLPAGQHMITFEAPSSQAGGLYSFRLVQ